MSLKRYIHTPKLFAYPSTKSTTKISIRIPAAFNNKVANSEILLTYNACFVEKNELVWIKNVDFGFELLPEILISL